MKQFLTQFRFPIIVTAIVLFLAMLLGIIFSFNLAQSGTAQAQARAESLAQGLAIVVVIVISPFWAYAAMEVGKQRAVEMKRARTRPAVPARKKHKSRK